MLFPNRCRVFHWFCFLPQLTPIPLHMSLLLLYLNKKKQSPGISVFTGFVSGSVIFSVNFNKAVTVTVNFSVTLTVAVTVTVVVAVFVNVTVTFAVAVSANVNVTVAVKLEATVTVTFTDVVLVTVNNRVTPSATIRAPTFFTGRRNLLQSVGCADANWDLFSLIFVVLFLGFWDVADGDDTSGGIYDDRSYHFLDSEHEYRLRKEPKGKYHSKRSRKSYRGQQSQSKKELDAAKKAAKQEKSKQREIKKELEAAEAAEAVEPEN